MLNHVKDTQRFLSALRHLVKNAFPFVFQAVMQFMASIQSLVLFIGMLCFVLRSFVNRKIVFLIIHKY